MSYRSVGGLLAVSVLIGVVACEDSSRPTEPETETSLSTLPA
jgi:hypothetical protein